MVGGAADGPGRKAIVRERSEQDCAFVWKKQSRGSALGYGSSGVLFSHFKISTVSIAFSCVCHLLAVLLFSVEKGNFLGVVLKTHSIDSSPSFGIPGHR